MFLLCLNTDHIKFTLQFKYSFCIASFDFFIQQVETNHLNIVNILTHHKITGLCYTDDLLLSRLTLLRMPSTRKLPLMMKMKRKARMPHPKMWGTTFTSWQHRYVICQTQHLHPSYTGRVFVRHNMYILATQVRYLSDTAFKSWLHK